MGKKRNSSRWPPVQDLTKQCLHSIHGVFIRKRVNMFTRHTLNEIKLPVVMVGTRSFTKRELSTVGEVAYHILQDHYGDDPLFFDADGHNIWIDKAAITEYAGLTRADRPDDDWLDGTEWV